MKKFILVIISALLILTGCGKNSAEGTSGSGKKVGSKAIKDMTVSRTSIVALTESGDLYAIGEVGGLGEGVKSTDKLTLLAHDVESFDANLYYMDNKGGVYMSGYTYEGGIHDTFKKAYDGASSFGDLLNFCIMVVDKNGDMFIDEKMSNSYCAISATDGFKKVASNVKMAVINSQTNGYIGYIGKDGNLYISYDNGENYQKLLDNVVSYETNPSLSIYLTGDGKLYKVTNKYDSTTGHYAVVELIMENVRDLKNDYIATNDNKFYYYTYDNQQGYYASPLEFGENVKQFLFHSYLNWGESHIAVYFDNNNKIILYKDGAVKKTLDNSYESIKEIYDFINAKS